MKMAIYVEGVTEASFVYRLIGEHYQWNWELFRLECLHLDPKEASGDLPNYGKDDAPDYYLIYDSCSDTAVSSDIKDRIDNHQKAGFDKVIGLRDVYSDNFKGLYPQRFDEQAVASFIKDMKDALKAFDTNGLARLCFAIMEIEAWILAMDDVFNRVDSRLTAQWLIEKAKVDVSKDPEKEYYHPYARLEAVYDSVAMPYSKHWEAIKKLIFKLNQKDFESLYISGKCNSFHEFYDTSFW